MIGVAWAIFRGSAALQFATAMLAVWIAWGANNVHQRNVGASRVVTEINTQAGKISAKAIEARGRGDVPDAAERLRQRSCRDC